MNDRWQSTQDQKWRSREAPRCSGCGHRRIFHLRTVRSETATNGRYKPVEQWVPCSLPDCTCAAFRPVEG